MFAAKLTNGQRAPTLNGQQLVVGIAGASVTLSDTLGRVLAAVALPNVLTKNGVVHVIDRGLTLFYISIKFILSDVELARFSKNIYVFSILRYKFDYICLLSVMVPPNLEADFAKLSNFTSSQ